MSLCLVLETGVIISKYQQLFLHVAKWILNVISNICWSFFDCLGMQIYHVQPIPPPRLQHILPSVHQAWLLPRFELVPAFSGCLARIKCHRFSFPLFSVPSGKVLICRGFFDVQHLLPQNTFFNPVVIIYIYYYILLLFHNNSFSA